MKAREFFSEVTDIDSRLLKTLIGLFKNPSRVVEASLADQPTYTKPLRYLLFTSTGFIAWRFIFEHYLLVLFVTQYPEVDGYWPRRIAAAAAQFINFQDAFFPFQLLFFVVPLAVLLLKVFFFSKSWREVRYIAFYSFGQFWIVLSVFIPLLVLLNNRLLLLILIAFGLIGFFFRKLLSKKVWVGLIKWIALGYLLTIWFYKVSLPVTQWGLVKIVLPDRYHDAGKPALPEQRVTLPIKERVEFVLHDPDNHFFHETEKPEGLLVECYRSDTAFVWRALLPGVAYSYKAVGVQLPSSERGFLILAKSQLSKGQVILLSGVGKILFTKVYPEEIVLNGCDMNNETLVLSGRKSSGTEITPLIEVLRLKVEADEGVFELAEERRHVLPEVDNILDDVYAVSNSKDGLELFVSKFETTKLSAISALEINRVSVMHMMVDSTIQILWETEIFKRSSKYWPLRGDDGAFQMRYDPSYRRILAFYSLADDRNKSAHLFWIDTLGVIKLHKKIEANEITYVTDVSSAEDGVYFCGWTALGIQSSFLGFGVQGLVGFVSAEGEVLRERVGKDRQGKFLTFYKIATDREVKVWGVREEGMLMHEGEWELMKFDPGLDVH